MLLVKQPPSNGEGIDHALGCSFEAQGLWAVAQERSPQAAGGRMIPPKKPRIGLGEKASFLPGAARGLQKVLRRLVFAGLWRSCPEIRQITLTPHPHPALAKSSVSTGLLKKLDTQQDFAVPKELSVYFLSRGSQAYSTAAPWCLCMPLPTPARVPHSGCRPWAERPMPRHTLLGLSLPL